MVFHDAYCMWHDLFTGMGNDALPDTKIKKN
jgi:hypothetical protein